MHAYTRLIAIVIATSLLAACEAAAPVRSDTAAGADPQSPKIQNVERTASSAWSPIENERVKVYAVDPGTLPAPPADTPVVQVDLDGNVGYLAPSGVVSMLIPARAVGGYQVWTELKDKAVAPLENRTGYPLAFPRPNVKKVLENDRVIVWDYTWAPGVPTPMHFHDKDVVVIYLEDGALRSTDPKGVSVINPHYFGFTKWNTRDRVHTEELTQGKGRAIITELK